MEDILFTVPTYDDDNDSWYTEHVWIYGYAKRCRYTICDSDGNHEPIGKREVNQLAKQETQLWRDYSAWVVKNKGKDPCGNFMAKRERKVKRNYVGHFSHWIGEKEHGLALTKVSWAGGKNSLPGELPDMFQKFLCLKKVGDRWCMEGITVDILKEEVGYVGRGYFKGTAEWNEPRPEKLVRAEVVKLAKKHLARG